MYIRSVENSVSFNIIGIAVQKARDSVSMSVIIQIFALAMLYCINNNLTFFIFLGADPASIALIKSTTTFITAILLFFILNRPINRIQWIAIILQVLGLAIEQYDPCKEKAILSIGIYFVLFISTFISAICSVWNEHLIKTLNISLHLQSI